MQLVGGEDEPSEWCKVRGSSYTGYNRIVGLEPLLSNSGLGTDDQLWLFDNPVRCDDHDKSLLETLGARGISFEFCRA
jgi:hypothetical protein